MGERYIERAVRAFSSADDMHMSKSYDEAQAWYLRSIALSLIAIARALPTIPHPDAER